MSRKILALAAAAAVLVPVLIVGLNGQVKDAPRAEKPQAVADPFLAPTPGKEEPKPETPAATSDNPFADPVPSGKKPTAEKPTAEKPAREAANKPTIAARDRGPLRAGENAILKVLDQPASLDYEDAPLADLIVYLSQEYRIPVVLDKKALGKANIAADTKLTCRVSDVPLRSALQLALDQIDLAWTIKSDVLLITTPDAAEQHLIVRTYDISDLIVPMTDYPYRGKSLPTSHGDQPFGGPGYSATPMGPMGGGGGGGMFNMLGGNLSDPMSHGSSGGSGGLIELLTSTIRSATWNAAGGSATIEEHDGLLVIAQTPTAHREIDALLADLREKKLAAPTILVELKWLWLDAKQHEQLVGEKQAAGGKRPLAVDAKVLEQLARTVPGFRGQIACSNRQCVHLASGDRRSVIVSSIPVIGSGVGYQPVVLVPNVGVVVELRPSVAPGASTALLDVQSTVTRWAKPQPPMERVGGSWPPFSVTEGGGDHPVVTPQETTQEPGGSASSPVERPQMPAQQLATTLRVPLGKPVIVGAMTFAPDGDAGLDKAGDNPRQLCLIATTSVASVETER